MKKLFFLCAAAGSIIALASDLGSSKNNLPSNEQLATIEATAACEVSSNASLNTGYCTKLVGSETDACVEKGDPACVRCCGNID